MRTALKTLIGVLAIIAGILGTSEVYARWENYRFARNAPLAAGLPNGIQQANDEFRRRIRERFPIGTLQSELIEILASQSFQLEQGTTQERKPQTYRAMHLVQKGDVITISRKDWYVSWQTDTGSRLTEVDASYYVTCS